MLTAYSYCRPVQIEYAVSKGVNVFMEKPFASDPAGLPPHPGGRSGRGQEAISRLPPGSKCRYSVARER